MMGRRHMASANLYGGLGRPRGGPGAEPPLGVRAPLGSESEAFEHLGVKKRLQLLFILQIQ